MSSLAAWTKAACLLLLASEAFASPIEKVEQLEKRAVCTKYTLIETRGTNEPQGPSNSFKTMNAAIIAQVMGGTEYDTVYPASIDQISVVGTTDIINQVNTGLKSDPNRCFILEGYSQGAAATVDAMPKLTGAAFNAIKGVFLIGNPHHKAGLACNVDATGGTTTKNVNGLTVLVSSIPATWVSKTLDVCAYGDGVCDTTHGLGITAAHLSYKSDANVQNQGIKFVTGKLQGTS
ncbi:cutinase [Aureobasidium sp. EXF-3400]|nr:cutinase [Aureobasidium sp. EXF-12344]KAI4778087.1 cutinase [Aureobasidium sp. EXF-3400]